MHLLKEAESILWRILALGLAVLLFVALAHGAQPSREVPAEEILKKIEAGQPVEYDNVTIVGDISERKLTIVHVERIRVAEYNHPLILDSKIIASAITITNSVIMGSIDFDTATLQSKVDLSGTKILGSAVFADARFNQSADFRGSRFEYTRFVGSQFNQSADFAGSQFNQESHFEDAHFLDADFNYSQFSNESFFDGSKINGTLSLYRTKYDKLNIRWSSIHDLAYDDTAYYHLIENFKTQGFFDDANECYYSYRCKHGWELLRHGKIINWLFDSLAWGTYGYGLRPERPLIWSIVFVLLGGIYLFTSKGIKRSNNDSEKVGCKMCTIWQKEIMPESCSKKVSIWEAFLLSATYYTSGASAIISSTPMEFTPQGKARYVVVLLRLSGWIFFVLFLSSLTRIV